MSVSGIMLLLCPFQINIPARDLPQHSFKQTIIYLNQITQGDSKMWNTNSNGTTVEESTIVKCNATETDVTSITGLALIEKLKKIARDNQIGKFDIFDSTGKSLSMADVESGNFTQPLSIVRYNVAA